MTRIFLTVIVFLAAFIAPEVHAMGALTKKDLADAQSSARNELNSLKDSFQIRIADRLAQVETLPGLEVTEPWVLRATSETSEPLLDVADGENVGSLQSSQLNPSNRSRDGGISF